MAELNADIDLVGRNGSAILMQEIVKEVGEVGAGGADRRVDGQVGGRHERQASKSTAYRWSREV